MTSAAPRGLLAGLLDKFVGWQKGLPPELCSYSITRLHFTLDDSVKLAADLYRPIDFKFLGTILVLSPYGIGLPGSLFNARVLASRGYQVFASCCRGTGDSEGINEPGRNEAADGHAVVAWMREQDWYTGSFATLGASYLGYNQWALLSDPPLDMKAAVIWTGPHDFSDFIWGTGALSSNIIAWADITRRMRRKDSIFSIIMHLRKQRVTLKPTLDSIPLLDAVDKYFDNDAPDWLKIALNRSDPNDDWYKPMNQNDAIDKANIPILLTTGWDDLILSNVMDQYKRLNNQGTDVALTVGPTTHLGAQGSAYIGESLKWLDKHLGQRPSSDRVSPVRIFVTGAQEWRDLPKWPPPTSNVELYLCGAKTLTREAPAADIEASTFNFDPANPTPAVGYPLLFDNGPGKEENNSILAIRSDVLVFDTEILEDDFEVCGVPVIELQHSANDPNADLWIVLSDLNPTSDRSRSISEKYMRLATDRAPGSMTVTLTDCAHRFRKGNKIRLLVAGGCHPRYVRNLGTGEDPVKGRAMKCVQHTVQHDASAVSKMILPTTKVV